MSYAAYVHVCLCTQLPMYTTATATSHPLQTLDLGVDAQLSQLNIQDQE